MLKQIFTAFHPEVFMQLIEGYWKVFVLMGIGYSCFILLLIVGRMRVVVECKITFIGKGIIVGSTDLFGYPDKEQ